MKKSRGETAPPSNALSTSPDYGQILKDKRREVMVTMGMKVDSISKLGRVGEEDQAQMSHDEFVNLRLNKIDYDVLKLVNEAIDRLKAGDYGICHRCEETIAPRRLQVLPWAKYCVRCQEKIAARENEEEEMPELAAVNG